MELTSDDNDGELENFMSSMSDIDVDIREQVMRSVVEHVSTSLGKGVVLNIRCCGLLSGK